MNLKVTKLIYTEPTSADTEIKYALVDAKLENPDLLLLIPPNDDGAAQRRIFNLAKKILKEFKTSGKLTFFATPKNFTDKDTVSQYVNDMFPGLNTSLPEISTGFEFIVVRF